MRVDLRPGFVSHIGPRGLQLWQRVLHLWLALERKHNNKDTERCNHGSNCSAAVHQQNRQVSVCLTLITKKLQLRIVDWEQKETSTRAKHEKERNERDKNRRFHLYISKWSMTNMH